MERARILPMVALRVDLRTKTKTDFVRKEGERCSCSFVAIPASGFSEPETTTRLKSSSTIYGAALGGATHVPGTGM